MPGGTPVGEAGARPINTAEGVFARDIEAPALGRWNQMPERLKQRAVGVASMAVFGEFVGEYVRSGGSTARATIAAGAHVLGKATEVIDKQ
jgi:hypothetical protein